VLPEASRNLIAGVGQNQITEDEPRTPSDNRRGPRAELQHQVRQHDMSEHLPWPVVVTYAVYAVFAAQQKFCYRDFKGASIGYHALLGYFGFFTSLFGIGFLIYYGFRTTWWAPLVLFSLGVLIYIPFSTLELVMERFMPLQAWGLMSFVVVPVCAGLLIWFTR
jgi:hypothetical protein